MKKFAALGLGLALNACTVKLEEASGVREETIERDLEIKREFERTCELFKIKLAKIKVYPEEVVSKAEKVKEEDLSLLRTEWYENILNGSSCDPAYSLYCDIEEPINLEPILNDNWEPKTQSYVSDQLWRLDCNIESYEINDDMYNKDIMRSEKNKMRDFDEAIKRRFDRY